MTMTINKTELLSSLKQKTMIVSFTKVNGDRRDMHCTLNKSILPTIVINEGDKPITPRKENPSVQSVWDVNAKAWRCFRWESIIEFSEVE